MLSEQEVGRLKDIPMAKKKSDSSFSNRLVALMTERGLTLRDAAKISGVSLSTVQSWRSGSIPHDWMAVKKLADTLGTSLSYLLTGIDEARSGMIPSVSQVFGDGGLLFDGFAKITIQRLIPKDKKLRKSMEDED